MKRKTVRLNGTTNMVCYIGNYVPKDDPLKRVFSQLIVPEKTRPLVMKLAHDSILAGHLGIQRTTTRGFSGQDFSVTSVDIVNHVTFAER